MPRVSIVVPNYNYARYLDERLTSIRNQSFADFEAIVVDDGSTDHSRPVIERHCEDRRLRPLWFDANSGSTYQRWNDGAALARGEYLWFAGADDGCEPEFLETVVQRLDRDRGAAMAYTRSRVIDHHGAGDRVTPSHPRWDQDFVSTAQDEVPFWLEQKTIPTASAVLLRRSLFERCGGFDTSFSLAADHLLWARLLREGSVVYVARPLTRFRAHAGTVRATTRSHDVVRERYRVFAFLAREFQMDPDACERLTERLAANWAQLMAQDLSAATLRSHREIRRAALALDARVTWRVSRLMVERRLGLRVRGPVAIARYAWRRGRRAVSLLRGRGILKQYSSHHHRAQQLFRQAGASSEATLSPVHDAGVIVMRPDAGRPPLGLPGDFDALVSRVAAAADRSLSRMADCRLVPRQEEPVSVAFTAEAPAVRNRTVVAIQLLDPLSLDGLHELSRPLLDALERRIYGSFTIVDKVYVYRSPVSERSPGASWVWHYDNHPREMLKVMIYLTDVTADTAPFEYLRHTQSGRPLPGAPLAPMHIKSRVSPDDVERYLASGYERHAVTGPRGTVIVFDDNVVHRGTLARTAHRDVVVLQVRPALFRAEARIDPRWTGSFLHHDFNRDPFDLVPHPKTSAGAA